MDRSYLYAPGHSPRLLAKVFVAGADAVILDLEDAVPPGDKAVARRLVADALAARPGCAWVRVNAACTPDCEADLAAVADRALGIRIPKASSSADVAWVADRAPESGPPCMSARISSWSARRPAWRPDRQRLPAPG
jgi:citrate lyase subunit beta / citryl-CoA lyase